MNPGDLVGAYRVVGKLGAGGMGEVYRARDTRLSRDVAIKALPAAAAMDPDRTTRFEREAQILAGVNHPHIAALFGVEQSGTSQFLVMELVEGGTLAERLESGPMSVRDAAEIGRQIADALQAAHDRGIIHRDLKPANIGFTTDGHVKVLDFGLAKIKDTAAVAGSGDGLETLAAATRTGVVMGTAAYMSPEQARGQTLDKRSDIFAFGCVLFEMLTGRNPFGGASISDILVAILERDPDWSLVPAKTPARVQWLLRRCLEKDPRRRLQDIGDARIELDEAITGRDSGSLAPAAEAPAPLHRRVAAREMAAWGIAALSIAGLVTLSFMSRSAEIADEPRIYNTLVELPPLARSTSREPSSRFAVSPDGHRIVFVGPGPAGMTMLWMRALDSAVAQPVAGSEGGTYPFWSPDSQSLAFTWRPDSDTTTVADSLKRIGVAGGQALTLAEVRFTSAGSWSSKGDILFTPTGNSPLHRVSADGGAAVEATELDRTGSHVQHAHPFFLPDGRRFLYTAIGSRTGAASPTGIYVASLERTETPRLLVEGASQGSFARGHLFYLLGSSLVARPFDPERLAFTGAAVPVAERIVTGQSGGGVIGAYSASASGTLAYRQVATVRSRLVWFDRSGQSAQTIGDEADWVDVVLSPDATQLATSKTDPALGTRDIWIFDLRRAIPERVTSTSADEFAPVWSPDGRGLIYSSAREGSPNLFRKTSLSGPEQRVEDGGLALGKFAASWSPDGRSILFIAGARTIARSDLVLLPVDGGKADAFLESPLIETQARFSPDGRWIVYASNPDGRLEVYVKPYGRAGEARRVSANGGRWPRWRSDSSEIVFVAPDERLMAAAVRVSGVDVNVGEIRPLFKMTPRPVARLDAYPYDMTPDAQRFIVNTSVEEPNASDLLTLIINWRGTR